MSLACFFNVAMPELLSSAKSAVEKGQSQGRDETYIKQLSDYIIPSLVEALHKVKILPIYYSDNLVSILPFLCAYINIYFVLQEPEVEICASMLDALNECIQVCNIPLSWWKICKLSLYLKCNSFDAYNLMYSLS